MKIVVTLFGFDPPTRKRDEKFKIETNRNDMIASDMRTILDFVDDRHPGLQFELLRGGVLNLIADKDQLDNRTVDNLRQIVQEAIAEIRS
jgi:hypothetical protein